MRNVALAFATGDSGGHWLAAGIALLGIGVLLLLVTVARHRRQKRRPW